MLRTNPSQITYSFASSNSNRFVYTALLRTGEPIDQVATVTDSLQCTVSFRYDFEGDMLVLTDQRGDPTTYGYDQLFRPISRTDPVGNTSTVTYDAMDNVVDAVDRLSRHVHTTYDDVYRPAMTTYADATVTRIFDGASRLTEIDDTEGGNINWTYDDANRILSETTPAGVVSYLYNAANQRTAMTASDRPPVTYGYDNAGRLQTITLGSEVFTYAYDSLSRRESLQRPNGVTTTYAYDNAYRLARLTHTNSAGTPIEDWQYGYDSDDEINSITSLTTTPLLPQPVTAAAADSANRITQFGSSTLTFDAEGQTTSKADSTGITNYQWDARGRLTQATLPGNQTVSYSYDGLNRQSTRATAGLTTNFLYDGLDVVLDHSSDGMSVDYLNGAHLDEKLRQGSGSASLYFLADHLGSTRLLTDAGGATAEVEQYEPFGAGSPGPLTRYHYTGRESDPLTGLMYYRARWYDPTQGRFLSEDPIGRGWDPFVYGSNPYAYAVNAPISFNDPGGLWPSQVKYGFGGEVHQASIARALSRYLSPEDIKVLQDSQHFADSDEFQTTETSYRHAMTGRGIETPEQARKKANTFIRVELTIARCLQQKGFHKEALIHLGLAMHTLQDSTSPAHHGFQEWDASWGSAFSSEGRAHYYKENFDPGQGSQLDLATLRAYQYFNGTFSMPDDFFSGLGVDARPPGK